MKTRRNRIQNFLNEIEKEWQDYFWDSVINYFRLESVSFSCLSRNPNISLERIIQNRHYSWNEDEMCMNPSFNFTQIQNTPYFKWNYYILSNNPSITWNDIKSKPNYNWRWRTLAEKEGITIDIIRSRFDLWNMKLLMHNPSVNLELIEANPDLDWDYKEFLLRKDLTFELILELQEKWNISLLDIHWSTISLQAFITWKIVIDNLYIKWDFNSLSYNPNINLKIILDNPEYPWSWKHYSYNPNLKFQDVLAYPNKNWDWEYISENIVSPAEFLENQNLPFCINSIQMNPKFSFDDYINIPTIYPNMNFISLNPSITLKDIRENRGYTWDWFWLSSCTFKKDKKNFKLVRFRRWMAAYKIQQWYWEIKHNPNYARGRKHINNMYDEIIK